jgi:hypothetical protein
MPKSSEHDVAISVATGTEESPSPTQDLADEGLPILVNHARACSVIGARGEP